MPVVALPKIDPYVENEKEYAQIDILWLANIVDTLNTVIEQIDRRLIALGG